MEDVYQKKVKENGLYSELIESFVKIGNFCFILGKPVTGIVAVRVLL